jgi:H/ACA ribonucleoprotein complex subunit 2
MSSDTTDEPKAKKQKTSKKERKSTDGSSSSSSSSKHAEKKSVLATTAETTEVKVDNTPSYEERCMAINILASPLASKKSTKKAHKLVRKASQSKSLRRGVKELVKGLRKGDKGLAILAGDVFPLDVMSHLPILLEEHNIPYLFVPSKRDLGAAACTKRPTSCVLIKGTKNDGKDIDGKELYDSLIEEAKEYDPNNR